MAEQILGNRVKLLDGSTTANEESAVIGVIGWLFKSLHIINPGGETVTVYKSLDDEGAGMNWVQHGDPVTADAFVTIHESVRFLKVVRGAGTTSVTAILAVDVSDR